MLIDPRVTVHHDQGRSSELRVAFYTYYFLRNRFSLIGQILSTLTMVLDSRLGGICPGITSLHPWLRGRQQRARAINAGSAAMD